MRRAKNKILPDIKQLLWMFDYDKENGQLLWKNHHHKTVLTKFKGKPAGKIKPHGYVSVMVLGQELYLHRIIWYIETGEQPATIDHINGDPTDNRISNLRATSQTGNAQNRICHREGHLLGTTYNKKEKKWRAQTSVNGTQKLIGRFNTQQQAHKAYLEFRGHG